MSNQKIVGGKNLLTAITAGRKLPEGYDEWAVRTVRLDFRSQHGFRYPFPGSVASAPGPINLAHTGNCPSAVGDGICASLTWAGMASGGESARLLLLVAFKSEHVLGRDDDKLRLSQFLIVDVLNGEDVVLGAENSNLNSANLNSANLSYANLSYADLRYADLSYANLRYADLNSANLNSANLNSANLNSADLSYANLSYADLRYADLSYADLRYADLNSANLNSANLKSANLRYADLSYADLKSANLNSANLSYASYDRDRWEIRPDGLVIPKV